MNDELKLTDEQLRLATSRTLQPGVSLDVAATAARDSYLALGSVVESAAGDFDEADLIARLSKVCVETTSSVVVEPRTSSARDWWPIVLSGALAAAGLVAIARIALVSQQANPLIAVVAKPDQPALIPFARSAVAWNDPLDDEIALAAATIEQFAGRRRGFDGSLLDMNARLDALSQELLGESL